MNSSHGPNSRRCAAQVRRDGSTAWTKLQAVLPTIRAEAADGAAAAPAGRRAPAAAAGAGSPAAPRVSALQRLGMPAVLEGGDRREGPRSAAVAARLGTQRVSFHVWGFGV